MVGANLASSLQGSVIYFFFKLCKPPEHSSSKARNHNFSHISICFCCLQFKDILYYVLGDGYVKNKQEGHYDQGPCNSVERSESSVAKTWDN